MRDLSQLAVQTQVDPLSEATISSSDIRVRLREGDTPEVTCDFQDSQEMQEFSSTRPQKTGIVRFGASASWILRPSDPPGVPCDFQDSQEMQEFSSTRPQKTGIVRFGASASWILRPSATPASVVLPSSPLLKMGLLLEEAVREIAIGAVAGGPYQDGETITGGTSGATGKVFRPASATPLRYVPVTGTFQTGEVVTGGTSGATSTTSGSPSSKGFKYSLTDSDFVGSGQSKHHATVEYLRGGYCWRGKGVLGELSLEFKNMLPGVAKSQMTGILAPPLDKPLYSIAAYPDEGIAEPRFVGAQLKMGGYSPTDIVDFSLTLPLGLEVREDANTASGILYTDYLRRGSPPIVTFEPAMVTKATFDFFGLYSSGATFAMSWSLGSAFDFFADECQFVNAGVGNRRSLATVPIQIRLCGKKNNEIQIWAKG